MGANLLTTINTIDVTTTLMMVYLLTATDGEICLNTVALLVHIAI